MPQVGVAIALCLPQTFPMQSKYRARPPRRTVSPPHVSLRDLRLATGMTLDDVITRIREEFPELTPPSRGTLSAIETGARGASGHMLAALCSAYGLRPDAIVTDYEPRRRASEDEAVPA